MPQAGLGQDGLPDVRIPLKTVEEGVEFLKARVRDVVEVVEPEALEEGGAVTRSETATNKITRSSTKLQRDQRKWDLESEWYRGM